jgi:hypothetical protein
MLSFMYMKSSEHICNVFMTNTNINKKAQTIRNALILLFFIYGLANVFKSEVI